MDFVTYDQDIILYVEAKVVSDSHNTHFRFEKHIFNSSYSYSPTGCSCFIFYFIWKGTYMNDNMYVDIHICTC